MDYWVGSDILGADEFIGPPSSQQLIDKGSAGFAKLNAEIAKANAPAHPSFLQREAFGGLKIWQAGALGIGVIGILSGVGVALFGRK